MKEKKIFFRKFKFFWILLISLAITACGGGGSSDKSTTSRTNSSKAVSSALLSSSSKSSTSTTTTSSSSKTSSSTGTSASIATSSSSTKTSSSIATTSSSSSSSSVVIVVDNISPSISMSANIDTNVSITSATTLTLTASATDNVGVTKVEFYDGLTLVSTVQNAPYKYSVNLNSSNNGTKSFKSVAFDAAGNATISNSILVTIDIDVTSPTSVALSTDSSNITTAGIFTLTATAYDEKGIQKIEFYDGASLIKTATQSPFTHSVYVTSANNGTKSYTAKAFDAAGNYKISSAVSVKIDIDTVAPSVSLTSSNMNVTAVGSITLTAAASDVGSGVTKVEFYDGSVLLNTDTTSPYTYVVNFNSNFIGTKNYTAKAYDAANNLATSSIVSVNVNITDLVAPTVVSASPAHNSQEVAPSTPVTITFSEAMKTDSVVGTLIVSDWSGSNSSSQTFTTAFSSDSKTLTLSVAGGFQRGKVYQFDINAKDLAGNLMAATYPLTITMEQIFAGVYTGKNASGSTTVKSAVEYYPHSATGTPTPTRTLEGANTLINNWKSLVIDSKGNQYISVPGGIAIFKAWDSGNVAPRRQITGANTGLTTPTTLALNAAETELFVFDASNAAVSVFNTTASGNVEPIRKISGTVGSVKDMILHQNEIFILGGAPSAPKIWVFNQSDDDDNNPTAKRVIDLPSSHSTINYLYAYGDKLLAPYGNASYQFVVVSTLAANTNGSGSFVMERYHSDMASTSPGTIAPPMLRVAGSQLWINYYGLIYKLDDDLSTLETGGVTPKFSTTGNNTPFIFVVP